MQRVKKQEEVAKTVVPEATVPEAVEKKAFKPVVFTSRHKAFAFEALPGRMIQFISNGFVGVYVAKNEKEVDAIRDDPEFGTEIHELAEGQQAPGKPSNIKFGPRSALTAQQIADQLDPKVQEIIIASNEAAKKEKRIGID